MFVQLYISFDIGAIVGKIKLLRDADILLISIHQNTVRPVFKLNHNPLLSTQSKVIFFTVIAIEGACYDRFYYNLPE